MCNPLDRIGVFMLADPLLGITLKQAKQTLDAVLDFNADGKVLGRAGLTGQKSTTTQWPDLLEYIFYAAITRQQGSAVRIYGDLQGMTQSMATEIHNMNAWLFGEWFGPSLDETGINAMVTQGYLREEAEAMLEGIQNALTTKALTGIEFQINRGNIQYLEPFIRLCVELGIEPHLEMQEMQFCRGDDLTQLRQRYQDNLSSQEQLQRIARIMVGITNEPLDQILSPFFCPGNGGPQYGQCNYWFENGLFVWPNGRGGLLRTACLSDKTVIDPNFEPSVARLTQHLNHPLIAMRKNLQQLNMTGTKCSNCTLWLTCRGGCRAMAYLASGNDFSPDPNCWKS